jgi:hypothetical protein
MVAKSIAISSSNSLLPPPLGSEMFAPLLPMLTIVLSIVMLLAIAARIDIYLHSNFPLSVGLKTHPNVGCQRCQYFSRNRYLKCALHPSTVLTEQAVDCIDYCPHSHSLLSGKKLDVVDSE